MAELRNNNPFRRSRKHWEARDFVNLPPRIVGPEQMRAVLSHWARGVNKARS
jgi:hypothetical protein